MNDFTKDELVTLYHMVSADCDYIIRDVSKLSRNEGTELIREFYVGMLKQYHATRLKIQSLIDNYCEHEMTQSKINDGLLYCVKCKIYEAHE